MWQAHRGAVTSVGVGETFIVTGGADGAVRVWQRSTLGLVVQFSEHRGSVMNVLVDVEKKNLIHSIGNDHLVISYDLKTSRPVIKHQTSTQTSLGGLSQRLDHEQELITGTSDGRIVFWDIDYAEAVAELGMESGNGKILAVKISPSGRYVACGTSQGAAVVFDLKTGESHEKHVTSASGPVTSIDWTKDERQVIIGSTDKTVGVMNFFVSN